MLNPFKNFASSTTVNMRPRHLVHHTLRSMLALIAVSSVLLTGLLLPVVGIAGIGGKYLSSAFSEVPSKFKPAPPSNQSVLLARDGSVIASFYAENRIVVNLNDISPWIQKGTVAIEDRRFFKHHGVDLEGMGRALINNLIGSNTQGASTITQQYVKNTLIDEGLKKGDNEAILEAREQTLERKLKEAKYAITIEKNMSKEEILQGYLNIAPYGQNVYGVEAASRYYYSKSAKDLNLAEASMLVGITQAPANLDPTAHPEAAEQRRDQVLYAMLEQKYITAKEYEETKKIKAKDILNVSERGQGCIAAGDAAYFCAYVVKEIQNNKAYGKTVEERQNLLLRGGLKIKTTLDPKLQAAATAQVMKAIPEDDPSGLSMALSSIEPGTGKVRALAQNTHYGIGTEQNPRATENNFNVDAAHGGGAGYQPGSSFKPFSLIEWYRVGKQPYTVLGGRTSYQASEFHAEGCTNMAVAPWSFTNATPGTTAPSTVVYGTMHSLNTTYAAMLSQLNMCDVRKTAEAIGARSGVDDRENVYGPSYILGVASIPPLNMANAYATIAARGKYCDPIVLESIETPEGKQLEVPSANCKRVLSEETADKTISTLRSTYNGFGWVTATGRSAIAKSGTTDRPDAAWILGAYPNLSTAVWAGYSEGHVRPLRNIQVNNRFYPILWGITLPAYTWRDYMKEITVSGALPVEEFTQAPFATYRGGLPAKDDKKKEEEDNNGNRQNNQGNQGNQGNNNPKPSE